MTDLLLEGGYRAVLALHLGALALLSAWGLGRALRSLSPGERAALSGLLVVGGLLAFSTPARPVVYFDEFFYVSIARNMATTGRAEPLLWQGHPPELRRVGHFQPPYPQGWPFLLSLAVPPGTPPGAALDEPRAWDRAVPVGRLLLAALPALAFLAGVRRFPLPVAAAGSAALLALPTVLHLAGSDAAECGALFFLALSATALSGFLRQPTGPGLGWLVLAATAAAEMRPEGLLVVPALLAVAAPAARELSRGTRLAWLAVAAALAFPPVAVMAGHDPTLAHHFEATPRAGFTPWGNRLANLANNARFFLDGRLWPLPMSLLALAGLAEARRPGNRALALVPAAWLGAVTLFLSWYPFGDYGAVNSLDTWRFAHHAVLPMGLLAALGATALVRAGRLPALAAAGLLGLALLAPWTHRGFMEAPHPLEPLGELAGQVARQREGRLVVVEAPEYACYLREGFGLPAVLAPVPRVPPSGMLLFAVDEGRDLPDPEAWGRSDLVPWALERRSVPAAAVFELRPAPGGP